MAFIDTKLCKQFFIWIKMDNSVIVHSFKRAGFRAPRSQNVDVNRRSLCKWRNWVFAVKNTLLEFQDFLQVILTLDFVTFEKKRVPKWRQLQFKSQIEVK